ncbi:hypothetical protein IF1G_00280 [Cordyceps javanica]|uniref:Uncharacterized protein n=1 Tax=Cordyceps javanica TaxID=43265 RepID=A0A545VF49_9HYPO|nr:hypothetical protein IF1G_00280 [Cordyceps javanica]
MFLTKLNIWHQECTKTIIQRCNTYTYADSCPDESLHPCPTLLDNPSRQFERAVLCPKQATTSVQTLERNAAMAHMVFVHQSHLQALGYVQFRPAPSLIASLLRSTKLYYVVRRHRHVDMCWANNSLSSMRVKHLLYGPDTQRQVVHR